MNGIKTLEEDGNWRNKDKEKNERKRTIKEWDIERREEYECRNKR